MTDQEAEQEVDMKYLTVYFLYKAKQGQGVGQADGQKQRQQKQSNKQAKKNEFTMQNQQ